MTNPVDDAGSSRVSPSSSKSWKRVLLTLVVVAAIGMTWTLLQRARSAPDVGKGYYRSARVGQSSNLQLHVTEFLVVTENQVRYSTYTTMIGPALLYRNPASGGMTEEVTHCVLERPSRSKSFDGQEVCTQSGASGDVSYSFDNGRWIRREGNAVTTLDAIDVREIPSELVTAELETSDVQQSGTDEVTTPQASLHCEPSSVGRNDRLKLTMSMPHGREFGVMSPNGVFYWVVYHPSLFGGSRSPVMTQDDFGKVETLTIRVSTFLGDPLIRGRDTSETIFTVPGTYQVVVADNLESDAELPTMCKVSFQP
jgi:hypothetical protein